MRQFKSIDSNQVYISLPPNFPFDLPDGTKEIEIDSTIIIRGSDGSKNKLRPGESTFYVRGDKLSAWYSDQWFAEYILNLFKQEIEDFDGVRLDIFVKNVNFS